MKLWTDYPFKALGSIFACMCIYLNLWELLSMWWSCRGEICKVSWLLIRNCYSCIIAAGCLEMYSHSRQCKGCIPTSVTYCTLGLMLKKQLLHWCAPDGNSNCTSHSGHAVVLKLESCIRWSQPTFCAYEPNVLSLDDFASRACL